MSVLKNVLFSVLVATSAVITIDAAQNVPSKIQKAPRFAPTLPSIAEAVNLPKKPKFRPLSPSFEAEVAGFALPGLLNIQAIQGSLAASPVVGLTILSAARAHNNVIPAPKVSVRTCNQTFYGSDKDLLPLIARLGSRLESCNCPDAQENESPKAPKLFHVLCIDCSDLCGQQVNTLFYRDGRLTCFEQRKAYHASKVDKVRQESKS